MFRFVKRQTQSNLCGCCRKKFRDWSPEEKKKRVTYLWQVLRNSVYYFGVMKQFKKQESFELNDSNLLGSEFSSEEEAEMVADEIMEALKWYIINPNTTLAHVWDYTIDVNNWVVAIILPLCFVFDDFFV